MFFCLIQPSSTQPMVGFTHTSPSIVDITHHTPFTHLYTDLSSLQKNISTKSSTFPQRLEAWNPWQPAMPSSEAANDKPTAEGNSPTAQWQPPGGALPLVPRLTQLGGVPGFHREAQGVLHLSNIEVPPASPASMARWIQAVLPGFCCWEIQF